MKVGGARGMAKINHGFKILKKIGKKFKFNRRRDSSKIRPVLPDISEQMRVQSKLDAIEFFTDDLIFLAKYKPQDLVDLLVNGVVSVSSILEIRVPDRGHILAELAVADSKYIETLVDKGILNLARLGRIRVNHVLHDPNDSLLEITILNHARKYKEALLVKWVDSGLLTKEDLFKKVHNLENSPLNLMAKTYPEVVVSLFIKLNLNIESSKLNPDLGIDSVVVMLACHQPDFFVNTWMFHHNWITFEECNQQVLGQYGLTIAELFEKKQGASLDKVLCGLHSLVYDPPEYHSVYSKLPTEGSGSKHYPSQLDFLSYLSSSESKPTSVTALSQPDDLSFKETASSLTDLSLSYFSCSESKPNSVTDLSQPDDLSFKETASSLTDLSLSYFSCSESLSSFSETERA